MDFDEVTKSAPQLPLVLSIRHGSNLSGPRECRKENPYSVTHVVRALTICYNFEIDPLWVTCSRWGGGSSGGINTYNCPTTRFAQWKINWGSKPSFGQCASAKIVLPILWRARTNKEKRFLRRMQGGRAR